MSAWKLKHLKRYLRLRRRVSSAPRWERQRGTDAPVYDRMVWWSATVTAQTPSGPLWVRGPR